MAQREEIQLNYRKTLRQADELERMAVQLISLSEREGENAVQGIQNAWHGDNAAYYCRKGERLILRIKQHGETLKRTAQVLRRAAKNTYSAEMRSIEIAERRKYR